DEPAEEDLVRAMDPEVVRRADVLTPGKVVLDRHVVVVERLVEEFAAAADVKHERHTRLAERVPEGVEVGVGWRFVTRRLRGHHDRRAAERARLRGRTRRAPWLGERPVGAGQRPRARGPEAPTGAAGRR